MVSKTKIAINGFGRIGRSLFRLLLDHPNFQVVAVNDLADIKSLAHLLKYDSIHGPLNRNLQVKADTIVVNENSTRFFQHSKPDDIPWDELEVDYVVEATGKFKHRAELEAHLKPGVKKVILSVPPIDNSIKMVVLGVNDHILDGTETIISNASCTTNNVAPMLKLMQENFGIAQAYITTVHSYTTDQSLHDQPHRDLRRSRAAAQSIIPTTTGAAKALTRIFPELSDVIGGCGIRVPVPNGSLSDLTLNLKKETSIEEVNQIFKAAASEEKFKGILSYTEDPIVSIDIINNTHSCVFDAEMTSVIGGKLLKIIGWYDNEYGYSSRLIDIISRVNNY